MTFMGMRAAGWFLSMVLFAGTSAVQASSAGQVRIYNWLEYMPADILEDFEQETGVSVQYDEYNSASVMENKLLTGNSGYDVVFVSSTSLRKLIVAGAVLPLDYEKLANANFLEPRFLQSLEAAGDQGNRHAVPYLWGATLIGYDAKRLDDVFPEGIPNTWDIIFKPEHLKQVANCGVGIIDAPEEILPIALYYLGFDPNTKSRREYRAAQQLIQAIKPSIKYFDSQRYGVDLADGSICLGVGWSGGFVQAQQIARAAGHPSNIVMTVPEEGAPFWSDVMVVANKSANPDQAHMFINYIMRPEVIARISQQLGYPAPHKAHGVNQGSSDEQDSRQMLMRSAEAQQFFTITPASEPTERVRARVWRSIKNTEQ